MLIIVITSYFMNCQRMNSIQTVFGSEDLGDVKKIADIHILKIEPDANPD